MDVKTATTDTDILKCWQVMFELRPHLKEENFLLDMRRTLDDNRRLTYNEEEKVTVAASVFEEGYNLYRGKYIYIDDLSTLP
jgi:hypothetical protein